MADSVVERCIAHIATLDRQPVCGDVDAAALCRALREPAPEQGVALEPLLDALFRDWIPRSFTAPSPGYLAFIPGGGTFPAALADFITNTTNRFTGVWQAAPALVQLEANALDWLRDWMGFPEDTRGLFTTGGSMATFNAIVCARERHLGAEIRRGVLYTSDQAHHSVLKSAKLAGVMPDRVRAIASDDRFRLRVDLLRDGHRRRSPGRADAVRRRVERGDDEHRRGRSARRDRRPVRRRRAVAPRRRRLRRVLLSVRRAARHAARPAARRFADARSAQGHVPAVRHRRAAGARRRGAARGARSDRRLPAGDAASGGFLRSQPARARAVARLSRAARLAVGEAVRRRRRFATRSPRSAR